MPRVEIPVIQPSQRALYESCSPEVGQQLEHKCGLGAVIVLDRSSDINTNPAEQLKTTLSALQNRGHDSAGLSCFTKDGKLITDSGDGTVNEAFSEEHPMPPADMYIGHVRYGTVGETEKKQTQPVLVSHNGWTMSLAHNGNIPDKYREWVRSKIPDDILEREKLELDSAEIAWVIVIAAGDTWEEKMHVLDDIPCAFELLMLAEDEYGEKSVYALGDRSGMWPMVIGKDEHMIVMASEDTGIPENMDRYYVRPGELVKTTRYGIEKMQFFDNPHEVRCIVQDGYGEDERAHLNPGLTAAKFREALGRQISAELADIQGKVIIAGVPNSGLPFARGVAQARGVDPETIIKKNPNYDGKKRTFIAKNEEERRRLAAEKYILENEDLLKGAKLILVDDSAIRGNTFVRLFELLKDKGLEELHLVAGLPKIVYDCNYGYYIKRDQDLLALRKPKKKDLEEGKEYILRTDKEMIEVITDNEETSTKVFIHFLSEEGLNKVYAETMHLEPNHICTACIGGGSGPDTLLQRASIRAYAD